MIRFFVTFLILTLQIGFAKASAIAIYQNDRITIKADNRLMIKLVETKKSITANANQSKTTRGLGGSNSFNLQLNFTNLRSEYCKSIYFKLTAAAATGANQDSSIDLLQQYGVGFKGNFGHFSLGQLASSNYALRINPAGIATDGLGIGGTYHLQDILQPLVASQISLNPGLWSDQYGYGIRRQYMPKINYITPLLAESFYLGASYTIGQTNSGLFNNGMKEKIYENSFGGRNVLQGGIRYIKQLSNRTNISLSITGEYITPSREKTIETISDSSKIKIGIPAWQGINLGIKLGYSGWQFAAEHSSFNHGKHTTLGVRYAIGPFALGGTYMRGDGLINDFVWDDAKIKIPSMAEYNNNTTVRQNVKFKRKYKIDRASIKANYRQNKHISWYGEIFYGKVKFPDDAKNSSRNSSKSRGIGFGISVLI